MKKHFILALLLLAFVLACDGYPGFMTDDSSDAAKTEELEFALNDKEYDKIIDKLDPDGDLSSVSSLNNRQKYLLQCAYMGKAGFDPIENLDKLLDDTGTDDPLNILVGAQGAMDQVLADTNSELYGNAANIHLDYNPDNDEDIMLAGTVASALRMVMGFTGLSMIGACSTDGVSFDENDLNYIGNCLPTDATSIDPAMIEDSLQIMEQLVNDPNLDGKVKEKIQEIYDEINAQGQDSDADNVLKYLQDNVFNK